MSWFVWMLPMQVLRSCQGLIDIWWGVSFCGKFIWFEKNEFVEKPMCLYSRYWEYWKYRGYRVLLTPIIIRIPIIPLHILYSLYSQYPYTSYILYTSILLMPFMSSFNFRKHFAEFELAAKSNFPWTLKWKLNSLLNLKLKKTNHHLAIAWFMQVKIS